MLRGAGRVVAVCAAFGVAITLAVPSSAAAKGEAQGVTKDSIKFVGIVPDFDRLEAQGIVLPGQTTQGYMEKLQAYTDAFGPINGRKIEWTTAAWDPSTRPRSTRPARRP